jgi:hypothetical protein
MLPKALAVWRLTASLNLVGRWIGKCAGTLPFMIFSSPVSQLAARELRFSMDHSWSCSAHLIRRPGVVWHRRGSAMQSWPSMRLPT